MDSDNLMQCIFQKKCKETPGHEHFWLKTDDISCGKSTQRVYKRTIVCIAPGRMVFSNIHGFKYCNAFLSSPKKHEVDGDVFPVMLPKLISRIFCNCSE